MSDKPHGRIEDYLRPPRIWWMRSAYAVEVNPWATREQIEAALALRGAIVSAHAYVETRLAELAFRSSMMPEYSELRDTFPYGQRKLLTYLRSIFSQGPLEPFGPSAERFFKRFDRGAELRHFMAHAKMRVEPHWIVFEDFKSVSHGKIINRRVPYTFKDLERRAWKSVCLSRICQHLANELETLGILPNKAIIVDPPISPLGL